MVRLALFQSGNRKFAVRSGARSHFTASPVMHGIQPVMGDKRLYTVWNGMIPDPFYSRSCSYTVRGELLSFSTRISIGKAGAG